MATGKRPNVVLGAGGPTGLEVVKRLLQVTSDPVRAVVRNPDKHRDKFPDSDQLSVVAGDVSSVESLKGALRDAKGVVFAASGSGFWSASGVDYEGVKKTAEAAKEVGADQMVLVSSMYTDPANRWNPVRLLLNNLRWGLMDYKHKGEEALKASGVPYTIVRPGGLSNGPAGEKELQSALNTTKETGGGSISRADVAAVCVDALQNPAAKNTTVSVWGSKEPLKGAQQEELSKVWVAK
jgi:uncharacterized protein YbjT (DUF2867 family)